MLLDSSSRYSTAAVYPDTPCITSNGERDDVKSNPSQSLTHERASAFAAACVRAYVVMACHYRCWCLHWCYGWMDYL